MAELPDNIDLVVFDFDGVLTDNRMWVFEDGRKAVACDCSDGMGIVMLRLAGIRVAVFSGSDHGALRERCRQLGVECWAGMVDKGKSLLALCNAEGLSILGVVYVGNDVNDLEAMKAAGYSMAPADAHPKIAGIATMVLTKCGGSGAAREACDLILEHLGKREHVTDGATRG